MAVRSIPAGVHSFNSRWEPLTWVSDRPLSPRVALSVGKEQPIGLLLVDQAVVIGDRLDPDLLEDRAKCIGNGELSV